ncbi:flavin reductase family protein [Clostridium sp. Marseille-P2415]|uniref:flavin reductase family protein n=1 Tax=Clostridium sp. Marseille-P2415 TaxID=1805471 RepID=UPI0009883E25|nr:flavin reductase [Clostridium sp. Marseille-P2415]
MKKVNVDYEKMYYGFPVILVSYYDKTGTPNVTTISSSYTLKDMVALGFSSKGHAIGQIKEMSDFVINIADSRLVEAVDFCGKNSGAVCKKFESLNLTPVPSAAVNAPVIEECPVSIECTLTDVIESENYKGITNVLARIKGRLVAETYLDANGRLNVSEFDDILYIGDGVNRGYRYMKKESN